MEIEYINKELYNQIMHNSISYMKEQKCEFCLYHKRERYFIGVYPELVNNNLKNNEKLNKIKNIIGGYIKQYNLIIDYTTEEELIEYLFNTFYFIIDSISNDYGNYYCFSNGKYSFIQEMIENYFSQMNLLCSYITDKYEFYIVNVGSRIVEIPIDDIYSRIDIIQDYPFQTFTLIEKIKIEDFNKLHFNNSTYVNINKELNRWIQSNLEDYYIRKYYKTLSNIFNINEYQCVFNEELRNYYSKFILSANLTCKYLEILDIDENNKRQLIDDNFFINIFNNNAISCSHKEYLDDIKFIFEDYILNDKIDTNYSRDIKGE